MSASVHGPTGTTTTSKRRCEAQGGPLSSIPRLDAVILVLQLFATLRFWRCRRSGLAGRAGTVSSRPRATPASMLRRSSTRMRNPGAEPDLEGTQPQRPGRPGHTAAPESTYSAPSFGCGGFRHPGRATARSGIRRGRRLCRPWKRRRGGLLLHCTFCVGARDSRPQRCAI